MPNSSLLLIFSAILSIFLILILERELIKTSMALAYSSPDHFAYNVMKGPGYLAVVAGEVIHIVKCVPVEVKIQHGGACFNQLQVERNNETWFMTPRTHILIKRGTQVPCSHTLPAYYKIDGFWYKILPRPIETIAPSIMQTYTKSNWEYKQPASLAVSGIYTDKDLTKLRERIIFPLERPALLNTLARGMTGQTVYSHGDNILNLFDEDAYERIVESAWSKIWGKFLTFGTVSAGFIAIMLIVQFIKLLIDTVIRGYTLHRIYGWSIHLVGAIFASITALLVHLGNRNDEERTPPRPSVDPEVQETPLLDRTKPPPMIQSATAPSTVSPTQRMYPGVNTTLSPEQNAQFMHQLGC